MYRREPGRSLPAGGVLLAGAEQEAHCLGLHVLAAALREQGRGCLLLGPALPWAALTSAVRRARPHTVVLWAQTPVTGRAYRLVRFARDFPVLRVYGAGPGWIEPLSEPALHLRTLPAAVDACLAASRSSGVTPTTFDTDRCRIVNAGRTLSRVTSLTRIVLRGG
ncbi:hypothetical protein GCM10027614_76440 [Micromonospora vulcania]